MGEIIIFLIMILSASALATAIKIWGGEDPLINKWKMKLEKRRIRRKANSSYKIF